MRADPQSDPQEEIPMYFTKYRDKRGEWRWNLKTANGNIIADSGEGYAKEVVSNRNRNVRG
jgi:hypothetical protein